MFGFLCAIYQSPFWLLGVLVSLPFLSAMTRSAGLPQRGHLCSFHLFMKEIKKGPKDASVEWKALGDEAFVWLVFGADIMADIFKAA